MNDTKIIVFDCYNTLIKIKESNHFFLKLYRSSQNGFGIDVLTYLQIVLKNNESELKNNLPSEFCNLYEEKLRNKKLT